VVRELYHTSNSRKHKTTFYHVLHLKHISRASHYRREHRKVSYSTPQLTVPAQISTDIVNAMAEASTPPYVKDEYIKDEEVKPEEIDAEDGNDEVRLRSS
jgi:hypothetical protein